MVRSRSAVDGPDRRACRRCWFAMGPGYLFADLMPIGNRSVELRGADPARVRSAALDASGPGRTRSHRQTAETRRSVCCALALPTSFRRWASRAWAALPMEVPTRRYCWKSIRAGGRRAGLRHQPEPQPGRGLPSRGSYYEDRQAGYIQVQRFGPFICRPSPMWHPAP